jgi:hypothetical protein
MSEPMRPRVCCQWLGGTAREQPCDRHPDFLLVAYFDENEAGALRWVKWACKRHAYRFVQRGLALPDLQGLRARPVNHALCTPGTAGCPACTVEVAA